MDNTVHRLHHALVAAIRQSRGDNFERPVTVAEIYQQLLPYRAARDMVGFQMNADYEYALLRLLAGEADLARLEPGEVRDALRAELESPNPNVSLFREYAACDVWVSPESDVEVDVDLEATRPARHELRFVPELVEDAEIEFEPEGSGADIEDRGSLRSARTQQCSFCGGELPQGRLINFCPHCGNDLTHRPCPACGEILEPMWRFCINCGGSASGFDTEAN